MTRIEKSVFISYRRADRWPALAVFKDLTQHGYDVFIDYEGIASGDFEGAILDNIRSRAHFVVLLTPTALERCDDPADWLRREIEAALEHRRNVVPLLLDGFDFASPLAIQRLHGSLDPLQRYQAIRVPKETEYFDAAMARLRDKYLAVPVEAVLHPASAHAQQIAVEQRDAASNAAAPAPTSTSHAPAAGKIFRNKLKDGGEGPQMVIIPAGRFVMGSPASEEGRRNNEGPQHEVVFAQPFALGVYAVSFDEYERSCKANKRKVPDDRGWGRASRPVIDVSWDEAQAYCRWLSEQTGRTYHLPSEAEWEYGARAGSTAAYPWGDEPGSHRANFDGSGSPWSAHQTAPVGSFSPNAFGLYDMIGNVWEWCQDRWHDSYEGAPTDGSSWESGDNARRVLRGGSWYNDRIFCRCASRPHLDPGYRDYNFGFRVCLAPPIK